jgi:Uma2 family endonuclease
MVGSVRWERGTRRRSRISTTFQRTGKAELVDGELVLMSPAGGLHAYAGGAIHASLFEYGHRTRSGIAIPDNAGFIVDLPNRRSFNPDVAFWTGGRLTPKFMDGAPVFAVEVRSEDDYGLAAERRLAAKRADYFAAGTKVVWDVDVRGPLVRVYRCATPLEPATCGPGDRADAEPAVPGWSMPVDDLLPR